MEKEKICGIYKITSPSGKIYIGQAVDIRRRFKEYNTLSNRIKKQVKLYRSFIKYNIENHIFEILEICNFEDLNCRERFWQDEFYVIGENGLNLKLTACGGRKYLHSEEVKEKIKNTMLGKHIGKNNPMYGKKPWLGRRHSEYTKNKISITKKKQVIDCTNYIVYSSYKDISDIIGMGYSCLRAKLNGQNPNNTPYQYLEDFLKDNTNFDTTIFTYYES